MYVSSLGGDSCCDRSRTLASFKQDASFYVGRSDASCFVCKFRLPILISGAVTRTFLSYKARYGILYVKRMQINRVPKLSQSIDQEGSQIAIRRYKGSSLASRDGAMSGRAGHSWDASGTLHSHHVDFTFARP